MFSRIGRVFTVVCSVSAVVAVSQPVSAGTDEFRVIAHTQFVTANPFQINPSINNAGNVAFRANLDTEANGQIGVYIGNGISSLVTALAPGALPGPGERAAGVTLSDAGAIAFAQEFTAQGERVYRWDSTNGLVSVVPNGEPFIVNEYSIPGMSTDGTIVFGSRNIGTGGGIVGAGVYTVQAGPLQPIEESAAPQGVGGPDISDNSRSIVFRMSGVGGDLDGIYLELDGQRRTVHTRTSGFQGGYSDPVTNDVGQIAFGQELASFTNAALYFDDGANPLQTIAARSATGFDSFGAVALNNDGETVFIARRQDGVEGIFSGADHINDLIIGLGSAFDGSTVVDLAFGRHGLNDRGQVAFYAELADGRQGVYIANIPSPAAPLVVVMGLGTILVRRRINAAVL